MVHLEYTTLLVKIGETWNVIFGLLQLLKTIMIDCAAIQFYYVSWFIQDD